MKTLYEIYEQFRRVHPTHANVNTGPCELCDTIAEYWGALNNLDRSVSSLQLKLSESIAIRRTIA